MSKQVEEQVEEMAEKVEGLIEVLDGRQTIKSITEKLNEVIQVINEMKASPAAKGRDNGPKSQRKLDNELAREILFGDSFHLTVKEACAKFGLSYGQVYSLREGYTFKAIQAEYEIFKAEMRAAG